MAFREIFDDSTHFSLQLFRTVPQTQRRMSQMLNPSSPVTRSKPGLTLLAAFLGWMFDGMEMGIFPLVAGPALREMGTAGGLVARIFASLLECCPKCVYKFRTGRDVGVRALMKCRSLLVG